MEQTLGDILTKAMMDNNNERDVNTMNKYIVDVTLFTDGFPKIGLIKILRILLGTGLKESKDIVEKMMGYDVCDSSTSQIILTGEQYAMFSYLLNTTEVYAEHGTTHNSYVHMGVVECIGYTKSITDFSTYDRST